MKTRLRILTALVNLTYFKGRVKYRLFLYREVLEDKELTDTERVNALNKHITEIGYTEAYATTSGKVVIINCRADFWGMVDTIAHELAHLYLYQKKVPYGDNDIEFHTFIRKKGISSSDASRFSKCRFDCSKMPDLLLFIAPILWTYDGPSVNEVMKGMKQCTPLS